VLAIGVAGCGPGYEEAGDIATFASESRFGGGAIYAVDDLANELSTLRDAAPSPASASTTMASRSHAAAPPADTGE